MKPANIKQYMEQQSEDYQRGWKDCLHVLEMYLDHEACSANMSYATNIEKVHKYIFEGVSGEYPSDEYRNRLEEILEDNLIDKGIIELKENV